MHTKMQGENFNENINREDLLRLLACLQSELEAREIVISALKSERSSSIDLRAKYGVINMNQNDASCSSDPFNALSRDSLTTPTVVSDGDAMMKHVYDTQLLQLDNLITSQRHAQIKMREQLILMEEKYVKACGELEQQRMKQDPCSSRDQISLAVIEKERDRLKYEVELEHAQTKRMEKALKRVILAWRQQRNLLLQQKQAAVSVLKERRRLLNQVALDQKRIHDLEKLLDTKTIGLKSLSQQTVGTSTADRLSVINFDETPESLPGSVVELNLECDSLRRVLSEEVSTRIQLQSNFEKLKRDYDKLANQSTISLGDTGPCTPKQPSSFTSPLSIDRVIDSTGSQRLKPNPPMRRSSEITNCPGLNSPTQPTATTSNPGSLDRPFRSNSDHSPLPNPSGSTVTDVTPSASSLNTAGCTLSVCTSSSISDSRSSTPSPPPPPPPVQLHYPYPGMQTTHSQSRAASCGPLSFLSTANSVGRPLSGPPVQHSVLAAHSLKTRSLLVSQQQPSTTPTYPYQTPSIQLVRRPQPVAISSRGFVSRKPTPTHAHPTSQSSSNYRPTLSLQTKQTPPPQQQHLSHSAPRSGSATLCSNSTGHNFQNYAPCRPHPPNLRPSRSVVPPSASGGGLAGTSPTMGTGHVCINGK